MPTITFNAAELVATVDLSDEELPVTLQRLVRAREIIRGFHPEGEGPGSWAQRGGSQGDANIHHFAWFPAVRPVRPVPETRSPSTDKPVTVVIT